jgi:peptidoglycan/xylan/chitin deacetylase (PgdA/CDA1 family)
MLNFRNTIIAFAVILVVLLAVDYLVPVSKLVYAGIILALLLLLAWGSKNIQSDFYIKSVNNGDRNTRHVALTFDDGPDAQVTPMILDVLKGYNVKAAFFIIGAKAELNPDLIKRIDREGHLIGSHSYSHHLFFDLFRSRRMEIEMIKTDNIIYSIIGKRMKLFRPPYGVTNPNLSKAINNLQYQSIGWSLKSNDTVIKDELKLLDNITSKLKNGDIILFHDNKPWNVRALENLIGYLIRNGYKVSRLDEFLTIHAYVY